MPLDIDWEIARRELKRCLTEEKSRAHSAFKLAQIKQKPNENLRIFILRYQDLHSAATGKTAAEDTDPTHIIRFLGMMTNSEIARKITQKGIPEGMTLGQAFTRAIELEAGYQLSEGVSLARPPEIMQVQGIEEVDEVAAMQNRFKDVVCWGCGEKGHLYRDCPHRRESVQDGEYDDSNESRDATLARIIAKAVAQQTKSIVEAVSKQKAEETQSLTDVFQRQMEETRAQYEELLKASHALNFTSTLKVTSSTDGFRVMDPFDWTADKNIYQRWQLWSHKARLALDAMEGDNEKTKISYLHHWLDGKGIDKIKGWMNSKILITQAEYDALEERDRKGKYSSDKIESYFSLVENILTPRSNPLLAVEELHLAKQGSMTSQEFYSQILEIVKRCHFPNQAAEERAVRDAIFIGMNSQQAKDKAINLMNEEEGKEVTVEFLINHLAVEDGNS